jgi:hypothetical protein
MDEVYDHKDAIDIINEYLWNKCVVEFVGWILPCINEASVRGWKLP